MVSTHQREITQLLLENALDLDKSKVLSYGKSQRICPSIRLEEEMESKILSKWTHPDQRHRNTILKKMMTTKNRAKQAP